MKFFFNKISIKTSTAIPGWEEDDRRLLIYFFTVLRSILTTAKVSCCLDVSFQRKILKSKRHRVEIKMCFAYSHSVNHPAGGGTRTTCALWPSRFSMTSSAVLWCFLGFTPVLWNHNLLSTTSTGTACTSFSLTSSQFLPKSWVWNVKRFFFFVSRCV